MAQLSLFENAIEAPLSIDRLLFKSTKKVMESPELAITELIANAWDAGATNIKIIWPTKDELFYIEDNGIGMTKDDFIYKWSNIGYDKSINDKEIQVKIGNKTIKRTAYGKNGLGKFAIFCFGKKIKVETAKNGILNEFIIELNNKNMFDIKQLPSQKTTWHGTKFYVIEPKNINYPEQEIKSYISQRYFTHQYFDININDNIVNFSSIPKECIKLNKDIDIENIGKIHIIILQKQEKDSTIRWSGILWRIQQRALGKCLSWKESGFGDIIDGRTDEGKGFIVIIDADTLSVKDGDFYWEDIDKSNKNYIITHDRVHKELEDFFSTSIQERKLEKITSVKKATSKDTESLSSISRKKVDTFITEVVNSCPSIKIHDLSRIVRILSTLETTNSKFAILEKLANFSKGDWDKFNSILHDWTIDMAKIALDEIKERLTLIEELRRKSADKNTLEVQDLQPLMEKCLWMFGPEFDSIEYTSNMSIAKCYQKYIGRRCQYQTSKNRPDFTILPDSALSFYSIPGFDDDHELSNISKLLIIELKAPSVAIGRDEKDQPLKYYDEFKSIGLIQESTHVNAYVVGSHIQKGFSLSPATDGNCKIQIITFDILLNRAEKRMFNLQKKLLSAPFMQRELELTSLE